MTMISWAPPSIPSDRPPAGPRARRLLIGGLCPGRALGGVRGRFQLLLRLRTAGPRLEWPVSAAALREYRSPTRRPLELAGSRLGEPTCRDKRRHQHRLIAACVLVDCSHEVTAHYCCHAPLEEGQRVVEELPPAAHGGHAYEAVELADLLPRHLELDPHQVLGHLHPSAAARPPAPPKMASSRRSISATFSRTSATSSTAGSSKPARRRIARRPTLGRLATRG